jgi:hypothetical protein
LYMSHYALCNGACRTMHSASYRRAVWYEVYLTKCTVILLESKVCRTNLTLCDKDKVVEE